MKVVVVGMLDRQMKLVEDLTLDYLDVKFASKEAHHGTGQDQMFAHADRVVMMTKFVSHGLSGKIPRDKLIYANGGLTRLREILGTLNATARINRISAAHTAFDKLFPAEEEEVDMATDSTYDLKLLLGPTGSTFEYDRVASQTADGFLLRMHQARSYYKKKYGVLSTQEVLGGKNKVRITITRSAAEYEALKADLPAPPVLAAAEAALADASPPDAIEEMKPDYSKAFFRGAVVQPRPELREFYCRVFLASLGLKPSADISEHLNCAKMAVEGLRGI